MNKPLTLMNHTKCECKCNKTEAQCHLEGKVKFFEYKKRQTLYWLFKTSYWIRYYANVFNLIVYLNVMATPHAPLCLVLIAHDVHVVIRYQEKRAIIVQNVGNDPIQCARENKDFQLKKIFFFLFAYSGCESVYPG